MSILSLHWSLRDRGWYVITIYIVSVYCLLTLSSLDLHAEGYQIVVPHLTIQADGYQIWYQIRMHQRCIGYICIGFI